MEGLTAIEAASLRSAEIENIIKKLESGKTLSSRESALIDRYLEANTGNTPDEVDESSLPVEDVVRRSTDGKIYYPKTYKEYGVIYGREGRTIRSWVEVGQAADVEALPPLHNPAAMVKWWREHMRQEVPERLLQVAEEFDPRDNSVLPEFQAEIDLDPVDLELGGEYHADQSLNQAQAVVELAFAKMQECYSKGDEPGVARWKKDWRESSEMARKWAQSINKIREERGELLRRAEVGEVILAIFSILARGFMSGLMKMAERLAPQVDRKERRKICIEVRDEVFAAIRRKPFAKEALEGLKIVKNEEIEQVEDWSI